MPTLEQLIAEYPSWRSTSADAVDISVMIFNLCRLPTDEERAFLDSAHKGYALRDWLNPIASAALTHEPVAPFPVGAAIVKEKFARQVSDGKLVLAALGLMLKREPGFDPEHGDWQFGYFSEAKGLSSGGPDFDGCRSCHASSSAVDSVYLDDTWRR